MKRLLLLSLMGLLLVSCDGSIQRDGANIKTMYFDNVPQTAIKVGEFDNAGIILHVDYSNRTSANYAVREDWLPKEYLHYLGEAGSYEVRIYFRGKESLLAFTMADNPDAPKYKVTFLDFQENEVETYTLGHRKDAVFHGQTPQREGYAFTGWDQSLYGVSHDMVYRPLYQPK